MMAHPKMNMMILKRLLIKSSPLLSLRKQHRPDRRFPAQIVYTKAKHIKMECLFHPLINAILAPVRTDRLPVPQWPAYSQEFFLTITFFTASIYFLFQTEFLPKFIISFGRFTERISYSDKFDGNRVTLGRTSATALPNPPAI